MQIFNLEKYIDQPVTSMHIGGDWHIATTNQSSDCDAIAIEIAGEFIAFKHKPAGENGDIIITPISRDDFRWYDIVVDLSGGIYRLEKIVYEDGYTDMVVFQSEIDHIHICSSDHNLIINKSIEDLSGPCYLLDDPSILLA